MALNTKTFAKHTKVLHVEIDPAEIGKNVAPDCYVNGDLKYVLAELNKALAQESRPEWMAQVEEWKKKKFDEYVSAVTILNFDQLREDLYADFDKMVKTAEEEGAFEKDDKGYREELRKFWASIDLKDL